MFFKKKNNYTQEFKYLSLKVKKKNIILVSGNVSFTGNSKYFFLENLKNNKLFNVYYVTYFKHIYDELKKNNLPSILFYDNCSLETINTLLYAQYTFSDFDLKADGKKNNLLHYSLTFGSKKISTYHGISLKRFNFQKENFLSSDPDMIYEYISKKEVDYFISPSKNVDKIWADHFYDPKKIIYMGHPIHNSFKSNHDKNELINVDMPIYNIVKDRHLEKKLNIFYCPTFRNINPENNNWFKNIKFSEINNFLKSKDILFIINFHPGDPNKKNLELRKEEYSNIKIAKESSDIYPSLNFSDLLITDYSSIAIDYLLLMKPIILFRPDHEQNFAKLKNWDYKFFDKINFEINDLHTFFKEFQTNFSKVNNKEYLNSLNEMKKRIFEHENDSFKKFDINKLLQNL